MNFESLLTTPEKHKEIYVKIDGENYLGSPLNKKEFIKSFDELGSLLLSDDKKYWILYQERFYPSYDEFYWCIKKEDINFVFENGEWVIYEDAIIEFDEEEIMHNIEEYNKSLKRYADFEKMFAHYIMYDKRATSDDFIIWQNVRAWINVPDEEVSDDNKVVFIDYVHKFWHAFFMDVVDGEYKYMNCLRMVWDSWNN